MTTPRLWPIDYQIEQSRPQPATPPPTRSPESRPQTQPARGVSAALGQATRTLQSTLQRAGQTIATGARTAARRAGEFAAWAERQQEELISRGRVTPATIAGTVASFTLPTTTMQIIGGQKKADIRNPETAIGLGSDILLAIPVAGAVARAARAGSTAARAARSTAARVAEVARAPPTPPPVDTSRLRLPRLTGGLTPPAEPPRPTPRPAVPASAVAQVGTDSYFINSLSSVYTIW